MCCASENMFSLWDCACDDFRSLAQVIVTRCAAGLVLMAGYLVGAPSGFRTPPVPHAMHVRMQIQQMPRVQPVRRVIHQELLESSVLLEVMLNCSHLSLHHSCMIILPRDILDLCPESRRKTCKNKNRLTNLQGLLRKWNYPTSGLLLNPFVWCLRKSLFASKSCQCTRQCKM